MKVLKVTDESFAQIANEANDKRSVCVRRLDDGSYHLEWSSRDFTNGNAYVCTRISLSEDAAMATVMCMSEIFSCNDSGGYQ